MEIDSKSEFDFAWHTRAEEGNREFSRLLTSITFQFQNVCGIGDAKYWRNFTNNTKITRVLEIFSASDPTQPPSRTGFVAIKDGYQCRPHPNKKGYSMCSYNNNSWYVELICSVSDNVPGKGTALLTEVKNAAIKAGVEYITMSALPYVIFFYAKLGYQLTLDANCIENEQLKMMATRIRTRLRELNYKSMDDPFERRDEEFIEFLKMCVAQGLAYSRQESADHKSVDCQDEECAVDGIYMTLCLPKKTYEFNIWSQVPTPPRQNFDDFMEKNYGNQMEE